MTVVAWDGRTLACDMQATVGNTAVTLSKMRIRREVALVITGYPDIMDAYIAHYIDRSKPAPNTPGNPTRLVIAKAGQLTWLEEGGTELQCLDKYIAFGSGMDYALGAMYAGADAEKAVLAAIHHGEGCGKGIQLYDTETNTYRQYFV